VQIGNETLALKTNGNRSTVFYGVTGPPEYGILMVDYGPVSNFSQTDVDLGRLIYHQWNLNSSVDAFELDVRDSARNHVRGILVEVIVEPLIRERDVVVDEVVDGPFQITLDQLDASELYALTGSLPRYEVFELPRLGTLSVTGQRRRRRAESAPRRRITRNRKDENDENDELGDKFFGKELTFNHDDIVDNRVLYTPNPNAPPGDVVDGPQEDGFNYMLRADGAQPASGSLKFKVELPPATEAPLVDEEGDENYYDYVDGAEDDGEIGPEYVTTALIVAGGALTSICSIVTYRCYRLSRRRRRKRRLRELEALRTDDDRLQDRPEPVERHAADLHPSEPLLTRSVWTEPMHVAASEAELRRIRAEHWMTEDQSRRRLNDALRCGGVESNVDDRPQSPRGTGGDQDRTLLRDAVNKRPQSPRDAQSPYSSNREDDVTPESALFDRFAGTQPRPTTRDDPMSDRQQGLPALSRLVGSPPRTTASDTAARQADTQPTGTDPLSPWVTDPRSTAPPSTGCSYPERDDGVASESSDSLSRPTAARFPGGPDSERRSSDRQTSGSTHRQLSRPDPDRPTPDHSSLPFPGLITPGSSNPHALRPLFTSSADRGATERDAVASAQTRERERGGDACADGSHCDDVIAGATPETVPGDVDGGYVTGSRPERQLIDRDMSAGHGDEARPAPAAQQVVYDWDRVDPQLIDLCRKTSPVLDTNQYWV